MSECTGLFPHELDPKNCSICRAAATQEDLIKMEKEANVDFLFSDVTENAVTKFNEEMHKKAQATVEAIRRGQALPPRPVDQTVRKTKWYERLKYAVKWRLQSWVTTIEIWLSEW